MTAVNNAMSALSASPNDIATRLGTIDVYILGYDNNRNLVGWWSFNVISSMVLYGIPQINQFHHDFSSMVLNQTLNK